MMDLRYFVKISLTMALVQPLLMHVSITEALFATLLLFLVIYLFSISSSSQDEGKYPPGPKPLPLLGNLHMLNLKKTYMSLWELSKQYGSVYTVHFGPKKVVILAGYKAVKQALVNLSEEFGDRDITPIFNDFNDGFGTNSLYMYYHGISFSNGENWREMRRFALANLRDFGMGKKRSEEIITEETQYLKEEFEKFEGKPFDTAQPVNLAVSNIISTIVYGSRFEYNNTELHNMVRRAYMTMEMIGSASVQLYNMFPWLRRFVKNRKRIMNNVREAFKQSEKLVNALQKTLNPQNPRGIVDSFLMRQQKDEGTSVWPLLASVLRDENEWETPDSFNPSHFLNKQGQFVKRDAFMPFSAGRRVCPGEGLARMELFLFFTYLLQHFRFTPPPGVSGDELDLTPVVGLTLNPAPHKLCAVKLS
ncbi:hypothetical protein cypCar_00047763 [Cyprinus carpio]|nr:hypothetical protein cypCar_00047763 [Cyprinus carpio]